MKNLLVMAFVPDHWLSSCAVTKKSNRERLAACAKSNFHGSNLNHC